MQTDPSCCPLSCLWPSASTTRGARLYPAEEQLRVFVRAVAPSTERSSQSMSNGAVAECHRHLSCLLSRQSVHSMRTQHFPCYAMLHKKQGLSVQPFCRSRRPRELAAWDITVCEESLTLWNKRERELWPVTRQSEEHRSQSKVNAETLTKTRETQAT